MTAYAIRFTSNSPILCAVSSSLIYDGYCLIDDKGSRYVAAHIYEQEYKTTHPQVKNVLVIPKDIIGRILEKRKGVIPVGYLLGKSISPLEGENKRFVCSNFIICNLLNGRYIVSPSDKKFFDKENLSGHIIGMFFANRTLNKSNLESAIAATLNCKSIIAILKSDAIGEQRAYINTNPIQDIGVFVQ